MKTFQQSKSNSLFTIFGFILLSGLFFSCKKMIDVGPPKTLTGNGDAFKTTGSASAALAGIYASMEGYVNANSSTLPGLSADELVSYSTPVSRYYNNTLSPSINDDFWSVYYNAIFQANNLIQQVGLSAGISASDKEQLIGEATFLRAFLHFYLVNYYGDVPYITGTDYQENSRIGRMSGSKEVYPLIIKDFLAAEASLSSDYPTAERVRVNKSCAAAMLARVYLYTGEWEKAAQYASVVIGTAGYELEPIENVFLRKSKEAIFQFSPNSTFLSFAAEARRYILTTAPTVSSGRVAMSSFLLNAFEASDLRRTKWVGSFTTGGQTYQYAYKYKSTQAAPLEYSIVLRLAEQYLIRAEAYAQLNRVSDARNDLTRLRSRAGLLALPLTMTREECLGRVAQERRIELFVEWGHRWLDLKRTGKADEVMPEVCKQKGGTWKPEWQLYPIPQAQMNTAVNFAGHQNPGY